MRKTPVLALTSDGRPLQWLDPHAAICIVYKGLVAWSPSTTDNTYYGGTSRITGSRSHIEVPNIIAVKGSFKKKDKAPTLTNETLFKRDLHLCGFCGKKHGEDALTRDHIVPVSKGGKDVWTNVVSACKRCNNHKGNKMLSECGMELLWLPYTPSFNESLILRNRKILFDQAEFIVNNGVHAESRVYRYLDEQCGIKL